MPDKNAPLILIIEDESDLVTLLSYNLEKEGFNVTAAYDAAGGLYKAEAERPDMILLDWMLPDLSGLDLCRQLRKNNLISQVPVIMLTARSEEADRIRGLNAGADDYVPKPFSPGELVARIRAVLRRTGGKSEAEQLEQAGIRMDLVAHRAYRDEVELRLGPTEFRLLRFFMQNPGRVFTREKLLDEVWGHDIHVEDRTVDVHVRRLRKALGEPDIIRTVRSAGYALDPDGRLGE